MKWIIDTTTGVNMQTVYLVETEAGDSVARVNSEAAARLISAAPDLLAALEKARTAFETLERWGQVPSHVVMLRYGIQELSAAIAKSQP